MCVYAHACMQKHINTHTTVEQSHLRVCLVLLSVPRADEGISVQALFWVDDVSSLLPDQS